MSVKETGISIRLAEAAVLIRSPTRNADTLEVTAAPPGMLRGLLTLDLAKPTKIVSIQLELQGTVRCQLADGALSGTAPETHTILSHKERVFPSDQQCLSASNYEGTTFDKGTYNYPIAIPIPPDVPPTLLGDHGRLTYRLAARARRVATGWFASSDISCVRDVMVVVAPPDDMAQSQFGSVAEREWDNRLRYRIESVGRAFSIDTSIPVRMTLVPMGPFALHAISAGLEEQVDYFSNFDVEHVARTDPKREWTLFSIRSPTNLPLLPLPTRDASRSPLAGFARTAEAVFRPQRKAADPTNPVPEGVEKARALEELAGAGPWNLLFDVDVPCCSSVHYSSKHSRSNLHITHTLKVILRVSRGSDETEYDARTGQPRQFNIVLSFPVDIFSSRVAPEYVALPPYDAIDGPQAFEHLHMANCKCCTDPNHASMGLSAPCIVHGFRKAADHCDAPELRQLSMADMERRADQFARLVAGEETPLGERAPVYAGFPSTAP